MSTKRKFPTKLGQPTLQQNAKLITKTNADESRAMISKGARSDGTAAATGDESDDMFAESGDEESEGGNEDEEDDEDDGEDAEDVEEDNDEDDHEDQAKEVRPNGQPRSLESRISKVSANDLEMDEAPNPSSLPDADDSASNPDNAEPSFGELVRAHSPVNVTAAFSDHDPSSNALQGNNALTIPGTSLGTTLTQALRTNDTPLLELCLRHRDSGTIRATLMRLPSSLAAILLSRLAARLHARPNRAGGLLPWVQWTVVCHGGFLATQPDLVKQLAALNRVLDERARSLKSLLVLKGKLEVLSAQMRLRATIGRRARPDGEEDEEDEERIVYVEGQDDDTEDDEINNRSKISAGRNDRPAPIDFNASDEDDDDDEEDEMPTTLGDRTVAGSDDSDSGDDGGFVDDEAEETDADSDEEDEDEVDHDDDDADSIDGGEDLEDESDEAPPPPSKLRKVGAFRR